MGKIGLINMKKGKLGIRPINIEEIWNSKIYGDFKILNEYKIDLGYKRQTFYDIQYLNTGTIIYKVQNSAIRKGTIVDTYFPIIQGVGYLGDVKNPSYEILYKRWERILSRCYNKSDKNYENYGGVGVYVSKEWHNFSVFLRDMKEKEHYNDLKNEGAYWQIDKDILCNEKGIYPHYYSNETVKIVSIGDNSTESNIRMNKFTKENMRGIYLQPDIRNPNNSSYVVTYSNKYKNINKHKSFAINKYGKEEALNMAINTRIKWEKQYSEGGNI